MESVTDEYRRATMEVLRVSFLSSFVFELFTSLSVAIVAVQVGLRLIAGGSIWMSHSSSCLAPEAFEPLRPLGASHHAAAEGVSATGKILDLSTRPPRRGAHLCHAAHTAGSSPAGCHRPSGRGPDLHLRQLFGVGPERGGGTGRPERLGEDHTAEVMLAFPGRARAP